MVPVGTMGVTPVRQLSIELMRLLREAARGTQKSFEGRWAEELGQRRRVEGLSEPEGGASPSVPTSHTQLPGGPAPLWSGRHPRRVSHLSLWEGRAQGTIHPPSQGCPSLGRSHRNHGGHSWVSGREQGPGLLAGSARSGCHGAGWWAEEAPGAKLLPAFREGVLDPA